MHKSVLEFNLTMHVNYSQPKFLIKKITLADETTH